MRIIPAGEIEQATDPRALVEALRTACRADWVAPGPEPHDIARPDRSPIRLELAPGWTDFAAQGHAERGYVGLGLTTGTPADNDTGSVSGLYLVYSGLTGEPLALLDGRTLAALRVAASSALAATYLARSDAARLLMVGAGRLAPYLIRAHRAVRPIREVLIWNRTPKTAERLARKLSTADRPVAATTDLEAAVRGADIVCCATRAATPLIDGRWLPAGVHLDLVGGQGDGLEADQRAVRLCRVYLDAGPRHRARAERARSAEASGGLGVVRGLPPEAVEGDLVDLTRGDQGGRRRYDDRTLFVSAGSAAQDLAAAVHILLRL